MIVVNLASTGHPGVLNLAFKHRIDWIGRVKSRTLSQEVHFFKFQVMGWFFSPLVDQVLKYARTGEGVELINAIVVLFV